jgi:hypothetical protein
MVDRERTGDPLLAKQSPPRVSPVFSVKRLPTQDVRFAMRICARRVRMYAFARSIATKVISVRRQPDGSGVTTFATNPSLAQGLRYALARKLAGAALRWNLNLVSRLSRSNAGPKWV